MQQMVSDKKTLEYIAENMLRLRGDRSYGQFAKETNERNAETGDKWKCYSATIQQIEACEHCPNILILKRICALWGVSLDAFTSAPEPAQRRRVAKAS